MTALDDPREIPQEAVAARDNGHCVVRGLANADEIAPYKAAIEKAVLGHAQNQVPLEERGTYGKAFLQVT